MFFDQRFEEWASDHSLLAARVLNQAAADLTLVVEQDLATANWKDGLVDANAFLRQRVMPRIKEVAEPLAISILEGANASLAEIIDERAVWSRKTDEAPLSANSFEGSGDIAAAIVPFGAGIAAAVALPAAAFTTTTGFLGLISVSTISWPILVGGGALAGLGIATGVLEGTKLWSKVEARLRRKARALIAAALIKGSPDHPSILEQLTSEFRLTAERAAGR